MIKKIFGVLNLFIFLSCSAQNTEVKKVTEKERAVLKEFQSISGTASLQLTKADEPGEELVLCLVFIDKKTKAPLQNQKVLFYQTSNDGDYHPKVAGDEKTARINGIGFTDAKGRIFIKTVLPGSYATRGDGRHIHMQVFDAQPKAYDIHFKQYTGARMRNFIKERDQFFLADLKYTKNKKLISFLTIEVKNPK
jgi:hypothetical protein